MIINLNTLDLNMFASRTNQRNSPNRSPGKQGSQANIGQKTQTVMKPTDQFVVPENADLGHLPPSNRGRGWNTSGMSGFASTGIKARKGSYQQNANPNRTTFMEDNPSDRLNVTTIDDPTNIYGYEMPTLNSSFQNVMMTTSQDHMSAEKN